MPPVAGGRFFTSIGSWGGARTRWAARAGPCGERGEWRVVLRAAAAETLREARRAASGYGGELLWGERRLRVRRRAALGGGDAVGSLTVALAGRFRPPRQLTLAFASAW